MDAEREFIPLNSSNYDAYELAPFINIHEKCLHQPVVTLNGKSLNVFRLRGSMLRHDQFDLIIVILCKF